MADAQSGTNDTKWMTPATTKSAIDNAVTPANVGFVLDQSGNKWRIGDTNFKYYKQISNIIPGPFVFSGNLKYAYKLNDSGGIDVYSTATCALIKSVALPSSAHPGNYSEKQFGYADPYTIITNYYSSGAGAMQHRVWNVGSDGIPTYASSFAASSGSHGITLWGGLVGDTTYRHASVIGNSRYIYLIGRYNNAYLFRYDKQTSTLTQLYSVDGGQPIPNGSDGCLYISGGKLVELINGSSSSPTTRLSSVSGTLYPFYTSKFCMIVSSSGFPNVKRIEYPSFKQTAITKNIPNNFILIDQDGNITGATFTSFFSDGVYAGYSTMLYESVDPTLIFTKTLTEIEQHFAGKQIVKGTVITNYSTGSSASWDNWGIVRISEVIVGVLSNE